MNVEDLDKLIAEVDRLSQGETDLDLRAELTGIRERMQRLRHSPMLSPEARGVITAEARRALGLGSGGVVEQPKTMQAAIQGMATSFKEARLDHDAKKGEVADFLELLWPGSSLTSKSDAATLLKQLETTRRFLIVIKKYLAGLNHDKLDGDLVFQLKDEQTFKDIYYGLLAKARIQENVIVRSGMSRNIKTERTYYDTSERPLIPDLDQRWATLWDGDNPVLQRLQQHNVYSGDTVDYLQREEQVVVLFYPGDVRERWAFSHKRSKPTASDIEELLARSGVKIGTYRVPAKKKELAEKHKKAKSDALLAEVLKIAGPDGVLAPVKQTRAHQALLNRHLSELIRDARIHESELLATYEHKYTVTEYVGKVKSLDKEIPDVARRVTEWTTRHESLTEQVTPLWELADARAKQSDDKYKAALLPALRALITDFPGGSVWDFAYASITGKSDKDGSKYKSKLASWRDAYNDDLVATFGEKQALTLPKDLPVMDVMCMWLFSAHIPKPKSGEAMPVSVFYWLWKQGHYDDLESDDDWMLPEDIDWPAFVKALPRKECEQVHDMAIRTWEVEMFEVHECLEWAKGNVEDRRTAKWIEHGNEIAQYVAEANGIIAFVDTYEGCYDKMESFINWVLFPSHELGRSAHYEHLAVGTGLVNFKVSISIEASLFSRINASATLSYQYTGKIAHEDDRRVRWSGTHSFSFGVAADAKLTLADMIETQTALDVLKASVAADKQLYSAVTVSVYESPKHLAAVWAEQLARARYWVTTPVNGISTPGGFQRFRGVPGSQTQSEILEKVVGGKGKLQEITKLLQRPRMRAKRRGLSDYASDWTLSAEISVPLMQAKAERLAEAKTVMHFSRRKMDEHSQPKERYTANLVTTTWSKNLYAFPFSPAKIDSAELGFSWTEVVKDPLENALDLYPEASTDPPTTELLGGFLEADNGSFDVGFTHIADHPNPDNDGMYLNIKSYRNWGAGIRGGDVTFTFQRTQKWVKIDPIKLRWHFNYMVESCRKFFREYAEDLPNLAPGKTIKEDLNDLIIGHIRRHNVQRVKSLSWREGQPLLHSKPGNSMMWRLRALSLFGAFELNFIYNEASGFEVQYGRIWITSKIVLGYKASIPPFPFLKVGAEIAGEMSHACFETLGLHTLSYILTVFNGCRKRLDPDEQKAEWKAWVKEHREELHALFNKLADKGSNAYVEVAADAGKGGKLGAAAKALIDACNVEFDQQIAPVKPLAPSKPRGGKIALGSSTGSPTVLGGVDFGATSLTLFCHVGWHNSTAFFRRGPKTYLRGSSSGRGKLISRDTTPIFVVRPANVYDIEFRLEHPKRIKSLELDVFNDTGASVLSAPWTIDATQLEPLFDPKKPTAPETKADYRGKLRWYGSKDGALKSGTIAKLVERELQGGAPLPATPTYYCMVLSVKEATAGPPDGAIAWTYFTVLDEPLTLLDDYLLAAGEAQDAERKPKWERVEAEEEEEEIPALPGRSESKAEAPKVEPPTSSPPTRPPLVEPERERRVPKLVVGIENLGKAEGYTCYLNSALQLIIQCRLLPHSRHTSKLDKPALAKDVFDFVDTYEAQRELGVDALAKTELAKLRAMRAKLHAAGVIPQLRAEDDAAAALFGLLDACSTAKPKPEQSASKLHFKLRVTKTYRPGVGREFASFKEGLELAEQYATLGEDDTTTAVQSHNHILIDGLPDTDTPQKLQALWDANWNADVSGDNVSSKIRNGVFYAAAQPLRQTIAFDGPPADPLLITLKRFSYDQITGRSAKISTPVEVQTRLTVGGKRHRLVGFIEHIGASLSTGHYVVYLRRRGDWYWCSDSRVKAVSTAELEDRLPHGYIYCFRQF